MRVGPAGPQRCMAMEADYQPIEDYGIIGDCRTSALVSRQGSIDWLCLPRFDGPAYFARILDRKKGGCFSVRPRADFRSHRRYLPGTNVLETTFETDEGVLRLLDFMPVTSEKRKRRLLWPDHQILRIMECSKGRVEVEALCDPRPAYGSVVPRLGDRGRLGFVYEHGANALLLRGDLEMQMLPDRSGVNGYAVLEEGERRCVSLSFTQGKPVVIPSFGTYADVMLDQTVDWWRSWIGRMDYEGPFRDAVARSALTLKLLTYAPSGAVVAAPTTSLPEEVGGERNWDYRFCWLRDASLTLTALFDLGFNEEGHGFLSWLLHSTALTWPDLQVVHDVHGENRLKEEELDHLEGYRGSRPVRIGNAARGQLQLDIYGEVVTALHEFAQRGGTIDRATGRKLVQLGEEVCRRWEEPDEGIWEPRSGRRHHTYSKVMCWVALDRLLDLHERGVLKAPAERFERERERIRNAVEAKGWDDELESYVTAFGEKKVDASLFLLGRYGYQDAGSPRMRSTYRRLRSELGRGPLIYRYRDRDDGLSGGEGTFGICSFWNVESLSQQGEVDQATKAFDGLLGYANDLGLYGEEIDPDGGAALGNFPQAFTHVGLIDAALGLAEALGRQGRGRPVETEGATAAPGPTGRASAAPAGAGGGAT